MTIGKHLFGKWTNKKWQLENRHLENQKYSTWSSPEGLSGIWSIPK